MLGEEDKDPVSSESPVTIGRVAFCVILILPIHNFVYLVTSPRFGADLGEAGMMLSIVMLFFSFALSIVGVLAILRRRTQNKPNGFWLLVTGLALVPLVATFLVAVYTNILRQGFD